MSVNLETQLQAVERRLYRDKWIAGVAGTFTVIALSVILASFIVNYMGGDYLFIYPSLIASIPVAFFSLGFTIKALTRLSDNSEKWKKIQAQILAHEV